MHNLFLSEFIRLPRARKLFFIEATLFLLLARLALTCLPFWVLQWFMNRLPKQPELQDEERKQTLKEVRWAVGRAARFLPGKTVCFPRGIVAQAMLRQRHIGSTLLYGAKTETDCGLVSHVWVWDGMQEVTGCRAATGYKIIARYPKLVYIFPKDLSKEVIMDDNTNKSSKETPRVWVTPRFECQDLKDALNTVVTPGSNDGSVNYS